MDDKPSRRVYKPELKRRTLRGETWLRMQEKAGRIPERRTDPGCKRKWWLDDEADAIVKGVAPFDELQDAWLSARHERSKDEAPCISRPSESMVRDCRIALGNSPSLAPGSHSTWIA